MKTAAICLVGPAAALLIVAGCQGDSASKKRRFHGDPRFMRRSRLEGRMDRVISGLEPRPGTGKGIVSFVPGGGFPSRRLAGHSKPREAGERSMPSPLVDVSGSVAVSDQVTFSPSGDWKPVIRPANSQGTEGDPMGLAPVVIAARRTKNGLNAWSLNTGKSVDLSREQGAALAKELSVAAKGGIAYLARFRRPLWKHGGAPTAQYGTQKELKISPHLKGSQLMTSYEDLSVSRPGPALALTSLSDAQASSDRVELSFQSYQECGWAGKVAKAAAAEPDGAAVPLISIVKVEEAEGMTEALVRTSFADGSLREKRIVLLDAMNAPIEPAETRSVEKDILIRMKTADWAKVAYLARNKVLHSQARFTLSLSRPAKLPSQ